MTTEPTDAELKAMWQLHAADIGGIFHYARAVLAKWGQPAQAAEPYGQVTTHSVTGQQFFYRWPEPPYLDTASECVRVFTAPQPVAREPLSHAQAKALVLKYGNDPLNLVFQVELANGIKGGQHVE